MRISMLSLVLGCVALLPLVALAQEDKLFIHPRVTIPAGFVRVRVPLMDDYALNGVYRRDGALIPRPAKSAAGKRPHVVVVGLDTVKGKSYATTAKLKSWGYPTAPGKTVVLPYLALPARPAKVAGDTAPLLRVYIRDLKVEAVDEAVLGSEQIHEADLLVGTWDLLRSADRLAQPRLCMMGGAEFFDASFPTSTVEVVKGEQAPEDWLIDNETGTGIGESLPFAAPLVIKAGRPTMAGSLRAHMDSKLEKVEVTLAMGLSVDEHVVISRRMAQHLGIVEKESPKLLAPFPLGIKRPLVQVQIAELRLAITAGLGKGAPREVVFELPTVTVAEDETVPDVAIGYSALHHGLKPAVTVGPDGAAQLYGLASPDKLQEPASGKKSKKK